MQPAVVPLVDERGESFNSTCGCILAGKLVEMTTFSTILEEPAIASGRAL